MKLILLIKCFINIKTILINLLLYKLDYHMTIDQQSDVYTKTKSGSTVIFSTDQNAKLELTSYSFKVKK